MPHSPCWANLNGLRIKAPASCGFSTSPAILSKYALPWCRSSVGLGSNRSIWLGPPFMNRWITALALGSKCGGRGAEVDGPTSRRLDGRRARGPVQILAQQRDQRGPVEPAGHPLEEAAPGRRRVGSWSTSLISINRRRGSSPSSGSRDSTTPARERPGRPAPGRRPGDLHSSVNRASASSPTAFSSSLGGRPKAIQRGPLDLPGRVVPRLAPRRAGRSCSARAWTMPLFIRCSACGATVESRRSRAVRVHLREVEVSRVRDHLLARLLHVDAAAATPPRCRRASPGRPPAPARGRRGRSGVSSSRPATSRSES